MKEITIAAISDTHTLHDQITVPECDILIHAGDYSGKGSVADTVEFGRWFGRQPARYKILVPGNHDIIFQRSFYEAKAYLPADVIVLVDNLVTIEGLNIYGTPWTPFFYDWAFNGLEFEPGDGNDYEGGPGRFAVPDADHPLMARVFSKIPENTDVLICHGPPKGILDNIRDFKRIGSQCLMNAIKRVKPKIFICGHAHDGHGYHELPETDCYNVACCNELYKIANQPTIIKVNV